MSTHETHPDLTLNCIFIDCLFLRTYNCTISKSTSVEIVETTTSSSRIHRLTVPDLAQVIEGVKEVMCAVIEKTQSSGSRCDRSTHPLIHILLHSRLLHHMAYLLTYLPMPAHNHYYFNSPTLTHAENFISLKAWVPF